MRIDIRLNPEITIDTLETRGLTVVGKKTRKGKNSPEKMEPTIHRLIVRGASDRPGIDMRYHGNLNQDIAAGEKDEEVHNFAVSAHVGGEGIFLEPSGYWYPQFRLPDGTPANDGLQEFELEVAAVAGFELVAGLEATGDGRWASPHPLDGLVLLGGPLDRYSRVHDGIALHTVLAKGKAEVADDILDTSAEYLDRYRPLIGPYPFSEFTVLEAFFSSGFAFPACTQIAGSQLSEYKAVSPSRLSGPRAAAQLVRERNPRRS